MRTFASLLLFCGSGAMAQIDPQVQVVRSYRQAHEVEIVKNFMSFLSIPNIAADPANLRRNADAVMALFSRHGINSRFLEHEGAPPVVYGELLTPGASRTLTFYAHYDGSPLNAKEWLKPPFEPSLRSA